MPYSSFCDGLILLSTMSLRFTHVVPNGRISFLFEGWMISHCVYIWGFPGDSVVKNLSAIAGATRDLGWMHPWVRRSPGGGNGNPFQYSCLDNPTGRGAWRATVHGDTTEWVSTQAVHIYIHHIFFIHQSVDILVVSMFWLLRIWLPGPWGYRPCNSTFMRQLK